MAVAVAALLGQDSWRAVDWRSGPQALVAWLSVLYASATGRPALEIAAEIQAMPLSELFDCLEG